MSKTRHHMSDLLIGAVCYEVVYEPDLHFVDDDGKKQTLYGQINHPTARIRINAEHAPDMQTATLWHEALHGILEQAGMDDHPEDAIRILGYGIVRLIMDNPGLVDVTLKRIPPE